MTQIGDGAAIFLGAQTPPTDVAFRQGHDFFYMTGVEIPDAVLVVDGMRKESVLFFTMDESTADGFAIPLDLVRAPANYSGGSGTRRAPPSAARSWHLWPDASSAS